MEKLSASDQKMLLDATERMIDYTNSGMHPNEALRKVAEHHKLAAPLIKQAAYAYNQSRTLAHMRKAAEDKRAESFPLADAVHVIQAMYPSETNITKTAALSKQAETVDYNTVDSVNFPSIKTENYKEDPDIAMQKLTATYCSLKKEAAAVRYNFNNSATRMVDLAKEAADYFHQMDHIPFAEVEGQIIAAHGNTGKNAMELIHMCGVREKRAEEMPKQAFYRRNSMPYATVEQMIRLGKDIMKYAEADMLAEGALTDFEDKYLNPKSPARTLDNFAGVTKKAEGPKPILGSKTMEGLGHLGLNTISSHGSESSAQRKALDSVLDPIHETNMAGIKIRAIVNDLMTHDPVLSAQEPKDVIRAYNHLSELSPTVAQQPTLARGIIRRMLQQEGVVEPFEAQQITGVEKNLRQPIAHGLSEESSAEGGKK